MPVKNRFNNLTSKEWLPFQKSWFIYQNDKELLQKNLLFFTQVNEEIKCPKVYYSGKQSNVFEVICETNSRALNNNSASLQFAMLDLRNAHKDIETYYLKKEQILEECASIYKRLDHRKFICIHISNLYEGDCCKPIAWDLAIALSKMFTLKDEKICCVDNGQGDVFYSLYLRKDEISAGDKNNNGLPIHTNSSPNQESFNLKQWHIIRPPRRKKNEILHPAKYPEQLIHLFLKEFSNVGDVVFDPMSGTGSTQVAALQLNRNAYGTELSTLFNDVANERCEAIETDAAFKIINLDARKIEPSLFPKIDYMITSPPYWNMLNMKGAEGQAKRKAKGLQLNYSDDSKDLGNEEDYNLFLDDLFGVYKSTFKLLKKGAYCTIIVKNIKKKGVQYPFAWHIYKFMIVEGFEMLKEVFWCQDDINIAPYGYGNTWVSNTFHQYCLTFKKV